MSSSTGNAGDSSWPNRGPVGGVDDDDDSLHPVRSPTQGIALNDGSTRLADRSEGYKKCHMVPIVQEGDQRVTLVQMCFRVAPSSAINDKPPH